MISRNDVYNDYGVGQVFESTQKRIRKSHLVFCGGIYFGGAFSFAAILTYLLGYEDRSIPVAAVGLFILVTTCFAVLAHDIRIEKNAKKMAKVQQEETRQRTLEQLNKALDKFYLVILDAEMDNDMELVKELSYHMLDIEMEISMLQQ